MTPDKVGGLLLPIGGIINEWLGQALSAALRGCGRVLLRVWRHWDYYRVCHFNRLLVGYFCSKIFIFLFKYSLMCEIAKLSLRREVCIVSSL